MGESFWRTAAIVFASTTVKDRRNMAMRCKIPQSRANVCAVLRYDAQVPTCTHDRLFDLSRIVELRTRSSERVSWPAIFMKAYALNAQRFPRLRQTWMNWPWPHLYQHDEDIGTLVVHRVFENDDWLFWGQITELTTRTLGQVQARINQFQTRPVEQIFKRQLWLARRSVLYRRFCWWTTFNMWGDKKCKRMGTFFLSTVSGKGAEIQEPPCPLTSGFTYGPIDEFGRTRVSITYDHRLMDGHHIADILAGLEDTINTTILDELRDGLSREAAA